MQEDFITRSIEQPRAGGRCNPFLIRRVDHDIGYVQIAKQKRSPIGGPCPLRLKEGRVAAERRTDGEDGSKAAVCANPQSVLAIERHRVHLLMRETRSCDANRINVNSLIIGRKQWVGAG